MELREHHLKAREEAVKVREQALLNDREEWKEWKEWVDKEISEDMEVLDHNRQTLEEWQELLGHLEEDK